MATTAYIPDSRQYEALVEAVTVDAANFVDWVEDNSYDGGSGERKFVAIPEIGDNSYYVEYLLRVSFKYNSDKDVFECGEPEYYPESYEIEILDVDGFIGEDEIDMDEPSKDKLMDRLNRTFYNKTFKAA